MAQQLLGKEVTASLNTRILEQVDILARKNIRPCLEIIRIGDQESDISYEKGAMKRCSLLQIECRTVHLGAEVSQEELLSVIERANRDEQVHGVLLLRPLPKYMDRHLVENALDPAKDVDCMTDASLLGVFTGKQTGLPPCTPQACMEILDHYGIDCTGKRAVVIGRSLVVGKPAAMMLLGRNATVTICHTKTENLEERAREADILLVCAGRAKMIDEKYLHQGQVVLDVGINVNEEGKLCGDLDMEAAEKAGALYTPVPGGVGSVTTSVLAAHVVEAAMRQTNTD